MKFTKRLFRCCIAGVFIWCVASVGTGMYLRPFIILFGWPLILLNSLFPTTAPDWIDRFSWSIDLLISLIAWLFVAALAATVTHLISVSRSRKADPKIQS